MTTAERSCSGDGQKGTLVKNSQAVQTSTLARTCACSFILSLACMSIVALFASRETNRIAREQLTHGKAIVPAKMLSAKFENDLLDARISFIYYVTIQKPGSLEKGMVRYRAAEQDLAALTALARQREQLRDLRTPISQLQADLNAYDAELKRTLSMVQSGVLRGPAYSEQVQVWAARGGQVVLDANSIEDSCFAISQRSSGAISTSFHAFQSRLWRLFACCSLLSGLLIFGFFLLAASKGRDVPGLQSAGVLLKRV